MQTDTETWTQVKCTFMLKLRKIVSNISIKVLMSWTESASELFLKALKKYAQKLILHFSQWE